MGVKAGGSHEGELTWKAGAEECKEKEETNIHLFTELITSLHRLHHKHGRTLNVFLLNAHTQKHVSMRCISLSRTCSLFVLSSLSVPLSVCPLEISLSVVMTTMAVQLEDRESE